MIAMSGPASTHSPSPELFFQTANSYQKTALLRAAVELEVFTAVAEGNQDVPSIAARIQATERGTRILCDNLTVTGFLMKQDGRYSLTPDSAQFLDRRSPAYMGGALEFLNTPRLMSAFDNLAEVIRQGHTVLSEEGAMEPENPMWVQFAHAMVPLMMMPAEAIAQAVGASRSGPMKVLDIAAGHGIFGITIARHNAKAEIHAVDWANVLEVAKENAAKAGIAGRYHTIPGSAFEADFGSGYNLVLLTNFLHHFDEPSCTGLLRKVHGALQNGGRAVTLEFVPDENRVTPPIPAGFSLITLAGTRGGEAYTFPELERMFRTAGFSSSERIALPGSPQTLVVSTK